MIQSEKDNQNPIVSPFRDQAARSDETETLEVNLRPQALPEYIGQEKIRTHISISIGAAKKREEPLEHILLYGPPGLGKTTLAFIIAKEMNVQIKTTSGPAIEKAGDLASILTNLSNHDILFIDEIHRLKPAIEEILYTAMEDYAIDLVVGKGPGARSMRLKIPKFTLIGATTKINMLSAPLRDRFIDIHKLEFYTPEEIGSILRRSATILGVNMEDEAGHMLSLRARRTPRIANRLLKRLRDYALMKDISTVTSTIAAEALELFGVDTLGLDQADLSLLDTLIRKFGGGPVGLNTLAAATGEEMGTIEDVYEPYLIQLGFLERTARGRMATPNAYNHLGLESVDSQSRLL